MLLIDLTRVYTLKSHIIFGLTKRYRKYILTNVEFCHLNYVNRLKEIFE